MGPGDGFAAAQAEAGPFVQRPGHVDRLAAPEGEGRPGRIAGFGGRRHGLAQEQIHVGRQRLGHLRVDGAGFRLGRHQIGAIAFGQGRQRTRHGHVLAAFPHGPTRKTSGEPGEFRIAVRQPCLGEIARDGGVAVGDDRIGAGVDVLPVDVDHQPGIVEQCARRPQAVRGVGPAPLDLAAHAAVEQRHRAATAGLEIVLTHAGRHRRTRTGLPASADRYAACVRRATCRAKSWVS